MGNYENGALTRQLIINACNRLFYEKGYNETSYADICAMAHVNRGTIYYHFHSKEEMRYDVLWNYLMANKHLAETYCPKDAYLYILAMRILYAQVDTDEKLRRFYLQTCLDYPLYSSKSDIGYFYFTVYDKMWETFLEKKKISQIAFASAYGYIMCCMRMLCETPERYASREIFSFVCKTCASVWGLPQQIIDNILTDVEQYLAIIPPEKLRFSLENVCLLS